MIINDIDKANLDKKNKVADQNERGRDNQVRRSREVETEVQK